jgi:hypothetical protein
MFSRWFALFGLIILFTGCGAANVPSGEGTPADTQTTVVPTDIPLPTPPPDTNTTGYPARPATPTLGTSSDGYPGATSEPQAATTVNPHEVLVVWQRGGGFAGVQDSVTVYADGRMVVDRNGTVTNGQVPELTMEELRSTLGSDEWRALDAEYGTPYADAFSYSITTGGKTVQTYDGVQAPEPLAMMLERFAALYDAGQ